ncbi:hypothetical protein DFP73DRAFT_488334, partial [Morchella snyderi]
EFLRFKQEEIIVLSNAFDLYSQYPHRYGASPTTALSVVLFRLAWPNRYKEMQHFFGRSPSWLSTVFNEACIYLYERYKDHVYWDQIRLSTHVLSAYAEAIHNGEPSGRIWGFIDGTHRPFCRPGPNTADQELFYSRYKKAHTIVWQAIVTPD